MISQKTKETLERLDEGRYINDRIIYLGGIPFTARDILIKAPLLSRLNAYFVGGTGRGKTQLGNDLIGYFSDASCYAMGRPDFEPSELLKQVRLGKLKEVEIDKDLIELTENVRKNLFFIDEMNRSPPIVQNYFFDFFDGKIVHDGKIMNLGKEGYTIGFATGNLGDGEYVGVSDSDRALKDRMHMIIKLDHPDYKPTPLNMHDLFRRKKNPRADMPSQTPSMTKEIIEASNEFMERDIHPLFPLLGIYLSEGLDYLENVKGNSKSACDTRWPNIEGIRTDIDEDKITVISPRSVYASIGLTGSLEMIAQAKGLEPNPAELFLDSLRFTIPYSGVLAPTYVNQMHNGDVYSAFDDALGKNSRNREDILEKIPRLEEALAFAEAGIVNPKLLKEIAHSEGRWIPVKQALEDYAKRISQNPTEESTKLKDLIAHIRGEQK